MSETSRSGQFVTCRNSSPEDESGSITEENRAGEVSNKPMSEISQKRKRSDNEDDDDDEEERDVLGEVDDDEDGFKTPTRPENRVPEIRECPAAPRKRRPELSDFAVRKRGYCRRRLDFLPEDIINSFFTDLQRRTTTKKMIEK